jgi:mono/diheme cytochrome c family protein
VTTAPTAAGATWLVDIGPMLSEVCGACHTGDGGMAGLDLSTYTGALQGGASGPAIVPGDPPGSLLVQRQQAGNHPGQLSPQELERVIAWILAGAPE